jgi:hypothetical protein
VQHLLQCVSNGNYYGRIKVGGKVIRESLKSDVWTTARLRRTDSLKEHQAARRIRMTDGACGVFIGLCSLILTSGWPPILRDSIELN